MASGYSARHVDVALVRADGVGGDDHALDHASAGRPRARVRSMNAPGSPSSALQMTYFSSPVACCWAKLPLHAGGEAGAAAAAQAGGLTSSMTCSGVIAVSALARAS